MVPKRRDMIYKKDLYKKINKPKGNEKVSGLFFPVLLGKLCIVNQGILFIWPVRVYGLVIYINRIIINGICSVVIIDL